MRTLQPDRADVRLRTLVISARPSNSATALARALGIRKLATEGRDITRAFDIINWGCSESKFSERYNRNLAGLQRRINPPNFVSIATNKLLTFQRLAEDPAIPIPEFTTEHGVADAWVREGIDVVLRQQLTGHSGEGIEIKEGQTSGPVTMAEAPLYVKYMKKKHEYRVHVILNGEVSHTDVQQKRKRQETPNEEVDYKVRNYQNGWVYCREELATPPGIRELAVRVVRQLGLDFGAVDIIWNQQYNQMTVLECNTAPGLEGQTLEFYTTHLREMI